MAKNKKRDSSMVGVVSYLDVSILAIFGSPNDDAHHGRD